ncbi:hypothetical protein HBF24_14885 [Oleiagrimonas sp. C23AA]|nr:hypothetical protein [Oleiagrimonas sp. C23AA]
MAIRGWMLGLCAALPMGAASAATPPTRSPDMVLRIERGPCFGACPEYSVTVLGDGSVTFIGHRHVASMGVHKRQMAPADYARLVKAVDGMDIYALDENYAVKATDQPTSYITVIGPKGAKRIRHYGAGCGPEGGAAPGPDNAPPALCRFERLLESLSGVSDWVGS